MRFGILVPTQLCGDDGRELPLGGPRVRALLARLLVDPGHLIGAEQLIDERAPLLSPLR